MSPFVLATTSPTAEVTGMTLAYSGGRKLLFTIGKAGVLWKLDRESHQFLDFKETVFQNVFSRIDPKTGEPTYRSDRMLTQLRLSGTLNECVGLVFGQCTNCPEAADEGSRTLEFVVRECADILEVPAMLGVPIGHIADQWTFPLGARATLNTDSRTVQVHRASHV